MNIPSKSSSVLDYACRKIPKEMVEKPILPKAQRAELLKTLKNDLSIPQDKRKLLSLNLRIGQFFESPIGKLLMKVFRK